MRGLTQLLHSLSSDVKSNPGWSQVYNSHTQATPPKQQQIKKFPIFTTLTDSIFKSDQQKHIYTNYNKAYWILLTEEIEVAFKNAKILTNPHIEYTILTSLILPADKHHIPKFLGIEDTFCRLNKSDKRPLHALKTQSQTFRNELCNNFPYARNKTRHLEHMTK